MHGRGRGANIFWLWALLPLLLAAALVIPKLGEIAFNGDETSSLLDGAGAYPSGPQSLFEIREHLAPEQTLGWPVLLFVWARLAGWSEVAVRALPFFAGLLTIATVFRAGRELFAPRAGLFAALLLAPAAFLHTHMLHARGFTLVMLFATLCLWCYWRIALGPRAPGRVEQAGLLLGASALLYTHYLASLLLLVLGLFHLILVPKTRRWWRPVLLLGLAALFASLQLPGLLQGLGRTSDNQDLHNRALDAPQLLAQFLQFLGNDLIAPGDAIGELLLWLLPLVMIACVLLQLRRGRPAGAGRLLVFAAATLLLAITTINEALRLITFSRLRYLSPLWPMMALLAGAGLHWLAGRWPRLVILLPALWVAAGVWLGLGTGLAYEMGNFSRSNLHRVAPAMHEHISAADFLAMDFHVANLDTRWYYAVSVGAEWETLRRFREDTYETVREVHEDYPWLWLMYRTKDRVGFADLPAELDRVFCERALEDWGLTLERYALHNVKNCPEVPVRLAFEDGIRLTAPEITVTDNRLRLDAHFRSDNGYLLANYSLAVHVIDPRTGERVAQGDTGVGPGHIAPLRSEIDISALPAGEYELRVSLYDWQTGARLPARDLQSGVSGDMHTLQRFRVG